MGIRGILFDKDGTLVDFFQTWMPAYEAALALIAAESETPGLVDRLWRLGGYDPASRELNPASLLASGTTLEICELWAAETGATDVPALARRLHDAMENYAAHYPVPVSEDIALLFERLIARGLKLGVATMDSEAVARATADALGISEHLCFVAGYDSGHGTKPGPGMVHAFCAASGIDAANVMVVGDTARDMDMARSAGAAMAVAVLTGATPRGAMDSHADHVIETIMGIDSLLGRR